MSVQRAGNPQAALALLVAKRERLQDELKVVEKTVYDLESTYLHDSSQCGSVLKGFETFISSSKNTGNLKRSKKFQPEDRLFSLSSITSPAVEEHAAGREADGRADGVLGRNKSGNFSNGPGKQKRGRTVPRDGKRIRPNSEQEPEEEEDLDVLPRKSSGLPVEDAPDGVLIWFGLGKESVHTVLKLFWLCGNSVQEKLSHPFVIQATIHQMTRHGEATL